MDELFAGSQSELELPSPQKGLNSHNLKMYQRTVDLTRSSIDYLESKGEKVTQAAISGVSKEFDEEGRGISQMTITRNPTARELFHRHSPEWQKRQARRAQQAVEEQAREGAKAAIDAEFDGLQRSDLIQRIRDLEKKVIKLKARVSKLSRQRDEAYELRDQALEQNTRQLVMLTKLQREQVERDMEKR